MCSLNVFIPTAMDELLVLTVIHRSVCSLEIVTVHPNCSSLGASSISALRILKMKMSEIIKNRSKKFRSAFSAGKSAIYTLIYACYCSYKKQFFEKKYEIFSNPTYPNSYFLLLFQETRFPKNY